MYASGIGYYSTVLLGDVEVLAGSLGAGEGGGRGKGSRMKMDSRGLLSSLIATGSRDRRKCRSPHLKEVGTANKKSSYKYKCEVSVRGEKAKSGLHRCT